MTTSSEKILILSAFLFMVIGVQFTQVLAEEDPRGVVDPTTGEEPDYSREFRGVVGLLAVSLFYVIVEKMMTTLRRQERYATKPVLWAFVTSQRAFRGVQFRSIKCRREP
jgi:hypothetical protein